MKASLFGFGRFGKLFYKFFKDDFEFSIYDKNLNDEEIQQLVNIKRAKPFKLEKSEIIFLTVPISSIELVVKEIKNSINKKALVVEMCSVKLYPQKILKKHLPQNPAAGIHPLFGPDSVKNSLSDHQIIIIDNEYKSPKLRYIVNVFEKKGLKIFTMAADEHDKLMAYSLCLTQFIGRALGKLKLPDKSIGTKGYFDLLDIINRTNNDTFQLFLDMNKYNPYSKEMREKVINEFINLNKWI